MFHEDRKKLEQAINQSYEEDIRRIELEMAQFYGEFFMKKGNKDFELYTKFPSLEALQMYARYFSDFPLKEAGILNVNEFAEVIKHLYQFQRQQEYRILTIGINEKTLDKNYLFEDDGEEIENKLSGDAKKLIPRMYYLIGNEKTLYPFYNGQFINRLVPKLKNW